MSFLNKLRRAGIKLALVGVILGLIIGLGIKAVEGLLASSISDLLHEEAQKACNCDFKADSINISLLQLRGKMIKPRLELNGEAKLLFERADARFSLSDLTHKKILLTDLHLQNGTALDVDEESVTYKFIDSLTTPAAPKPHNEDRWKLKLIGLRVSDSNFIQDYPASQLLAKRIALKLSRDTKDDFILKPYIDELVIHLKNSPGSSNGRDIKLGKVSSVIELTDTTAIFQHLRLRNKPSIVKAEASSQSKKGNKLSGLANYRLTTNLLQLDDFLSGELTGNGTLSGSLGQPALKGNFQLDQDQKLHFHISDVPIFSLDNLQTDLDYKLLDGIHHLKLNNLVASAPGTVVQQSEQFELLDDEIKGGFKISAEQVEVLGFTLHNSQLAVDVSQNLKSPSVNVTGTIGALELGNIRTPQLNINYSGLETHKINIQHKSREFGSLNWYSEFKNSQNDEILQTTAINLEKFVLSVVKLNNNTDNFDTVDTVTLTGHLNMSDITSLTGLSGQGKLLVQSTYFDRQSDLSTDVTIKNGIISSSIKNSSSTLTASTNINLINPNSESSLKINLSNFQPAEHSRASSCIKTSADLVYRFKLNAYAAGQGNLNLSDFQLGCKPFTATLVRPKNNYPIFEGILKLDQLQLKSDTTDLMISGSASLTQLNLQSSGKLNLNSLLGFMPVLDDLQGTLESKLSITGPSSFPEVRGQARIIDADLASETLDISAHDVYGELDLQGPVIEVKQLAGLVNNGQTLVNGNINFLDFAKSIIEVNFANFVVDSIPDTNVQLTGNLAISEAPSGIARVTGIVQLDTVELLKELKAIDLVKNLFSTIIPIRKNSTSNIEKSQSELEIELDLAITAQRNVILISNFISAEFAADLRVTGTLSNPQIQGQLKVLSGWLGLKNQRFDITSGTLIFNTYGTMPEIDLVAETSVFSKAGNFIPVILEAKGTLNNPRIELSSDSGYSSQELLALLTGGGVREIESTSINRFNTFKGSEALALFDKSNSEPLSYLLYRLTTIDEISIEPALNSRTGSIEPQLSVTKYLTDRLALVGESFLDTEGYSRLKARLDLGKDLSLVGLIDSSSNEQNSALGVDLIYTVLAKRIPYVNYDISGVRAFSHNELLQALRLNTDSRIRIEELDAISSATTNLLREQGYSNADTISTCLEQLGFCRNLKLQVKEGKRQKVTERILQGSSLPKEITANSIAPFKKGVSATAALLKKETEYFTNRLRSEGYLSSRVNASYESSTDNKVKLLINIFTGPQQRFSFSGNSVFSSAEFLDTINIFKRKQPFGRNTVNILLKNIERMYREAGYLYATIHHEQKESADRTSTEHIITIKEEQPLIIEQIVFTGNHQLKEPKLREHVKANSEVAFAQLFKMQSLVDEKISANIALLKEIYRQLGYDSVSITHQIVNGTKNNTLILEYVINEGTPKLFDRIELVNWPSSITKLTQLPPPFSIAQANQYLHDLKQHLNSNGYKVVSMHTSVDTAHKKLQVKIQHGTFNHISTIKVEGLTNVSEKIVLDYVQLKIGDIVSKQKLSEARARLLSLGLFSRVEIITNSAADNKQGEELLIRLTERPLTTLEVGTGLNSELGLHLFGEAIDKSLLRDGRSISFRVDGYFDQVTSDVSQGIASLRYSAPSLFNSPLRLTQDLRYQKLDLDTLDFNLERSISDTSLHKSLSKESVATLSYLLFQDQLSDVPTDAQIGSLDQGTVTLSALGGSIRWDWRDNPVLPNQGYTFTIEPSISSELIGSDANYYAIGSRFSGLHPFNTGRFAIAHNTKVNSSWTFSDTDQIPITQRYYAGGRQSIRGFRENSLGPLGAGGSIIGGDLLVINNFELRYNFEDTFSTLIFFDIGSVFLQDQSFDSSEIRESTGVGFRYLSPIGPIGFDIGHPLDERPGEPSVRLHFSIGAVF